MLSKNRGRFVLKVYFTRLLEYFYFGNLRIMKNLPNKKQDFTDKDIQRYREIFKNYELKDQEIKELKDHFEEMAGLLVDVWLDKKESYKNIELPNKNKASE